MKYMLLLLLAACDPAATFVNECGLACLRTNQQMESASYESKGSQVCRCRPHPAPPAEASR